MIRSFTLYLLLLANFVQAQQLESFELLSPDSKELTDFHFLNKELEGKRLIMLGEMTHMYGSIFEMKARVVEYLHKELGYTTLAMESPMYDLWMMRKTVGFSPKVFNNSIFNVWSDTEEFQRLVSYIAENELKVIGFDSQVLNTTKFIDDFFEYCHNENIKILLNEDDMAIQIEGILEVLQFEEDDIKFKDFEKELKRIITEINKLENSDKNYHYLQHAKNLLATARDAYYNTEDILSVNFADKQHNFRDAQMADNLLSYMARNENEKIIGWADNIHIINNMTSIKKDTIRDFIPMGSHLKKVLGNTVYSLATIHANDSLLQKTTWYQTPVLENSFEHKLKSLHKPFLFVTSNQLEMRKPMQHRLLSFIEFTEGRLDQLFDGYIFIENATIPKNQKVFFKEKNKINFIKKLQSDSTYSKRNKIAVKRKIVDAELNIPISYANIEIINAEIYRIADVNGLFELPENKEIPANTTVQISSMGYQTKRIPFNKLEEEIYLNPSIESLGTVEIIAAKSPKSVLKKAIKQIIYNNPLEPFNSKRYIHNISNINDETILDIELITKEYDQGYRQAFVATRKLLHKKWNKNLESKKTEASLFNFGGRENAIQYANILHKRKYKKFDIHFMKSKNVKHDSLYILSFSTDRRKWNFTNRGYPTKYSGKVYINRADFAIIKVEQSWETTLNKDDLLKYKFWLGERVLNKDIKEMKIIEESTSQYLNELDKKYYASNNFKRFYTETIDENDKFENTLYESKSAFFDTDTKNIDVIDYKYRVNKHKLLKKINYDEDFWKSFYETTFQQLHID